MLLLFLRKLKSFFSVGPFPVIPCHFSDSELIASTLAKNGGVSFTAPSSSVDLSNLFNPHELLSARKETRVTSAAAYSAYYGSQYRSTTPTKTTFRFSKPKAIFPDLGMIDIFKPDLNSNQLFFLQQVHALVDPILEKAFPNCFIFGDYHIYIYEGVKTPRCFHRDNYRPRLKVFVSLSDVVNLQDGCYAIKHQSHSSNFFKKIQLYCNKLFGSDIGSSLGDATLTNYKEMHYYPVRKGDIIISRQDAIHGDFPMPKNKSKSLLVMNYYLKASAN